MPLQFRARWNLAPALHADAPDRTMVDGLSNTEPHINAIIFEAQRNGGFMEPIIIAMLNQAVAPAGAQVVIRQGIHQVEDIGQHGDGFNLHIGTGFNGNNFHLNIHQTGSGRLYVSSISYGLNGAVNEARHTPPPP